MCYVKWGKKRAAGISLLFADTKLPKYPRELFFVRDLTGDLAEEMKSAADIEGEQVTADAIVEAGMDFAERNGDHNQRIVVAGIGYYGAFVNLFPLQYFRNK